MTKRRHKPKADEPFDILAAFRSGPVLKRRTPAYKAAKGVIRTFSLVKRLRRDPATQKPDLRERQAQSDAYLDDRDLSETEMEKRYTSVMEAEDDRLCAENLPALFVGALVEPKIAERLPGYIARCETFWVENCFIDHDVPHPMWLPAYVEFFRSLPGSGPVLEAKRTEIVAKFESAEKYPDWFSVSPCEVLLLALLRDSREKVRNYVDGLKQKDPTATAKLRMELGLTPCVKTDPLVYEALLFAVLGLGDARELVNKVLNAVVCIPVVTQYDEYERTELNPPDSRANLYNAEVWGLIHSLVDMGERWRYHFSEHADGWKRHAHPAKNVLVWGKLDEHGFLYAVPGYLAFPELGGKEFAELNRMVCAEIARWCNEGPVPQLSRRAASAGPADRKTQLRRLLEKTPPDFMVKRDDLMAALDLGQTKFYAIRKRPGFPAPVDRKYDLIAVCWWCDENNAFCDPARITRIGPKFDEWLKSRLTQNMAPPPTDG